MPSGLPVAKPKSVDSLRKQLSAHMCLRAQQSWPPLLHVSVSVLLAWLHTTFFCRIILARMQSLRLAATHIRYPHCLSRVRQLVPGFLGDSSRSDQRHRNLWARPGIDHCGIQKKTYPDHGRELYVWACHLGGSLCARLYRGHRLEAPVKKSQQLWSGKNLVHKSLDNP